MLAKLIAVVLGLTLTATSLLVVRQQRLQAVSEMTEAIGRAEALERRTWRLRAEIGAMSAPSELRAALERVGPFEPIRGEAQTIRIAPSDAVAGRGAVWVPMDHADTRSGARRGVVR